MRTKARRISLVAAIALVALVMLQVPGTLATDTAVTFRTTTWQELIPKDWDPRKHFRDQNASSIREGSARELALMREMRDSWDNAPTRSDLDGAMLRLPGYVVPLDHQRRLQTVVSYRTFFSA